jgi:hypothetical protein
VLDQFKNRVSVVLCHAKVSRASRAESAYPRDEAFSTDKILPMNAFWNSFETVLGLGVEPRNLTFVQISLRGIIVFSCHAGRSAAWAQTLTLAENSIRRCPACDSCRSAFSRHSTRDLGEDMRLCVPIDDLSRIRIARVERSGDISFIRK